MENFKSNNRVRKLSTSSGKFRHTNRKILQRIQILQWLPFYTKFDFISDLVGGITVGMMMIPQSIAYAGLASLPAQYGLYTAFIGSYTYVLFGTIKEVSIGPTSLLAMLTFTYLEGYSVDFVIFLTFIAGCVELSMGLLNLGFLVDFISPSVSAGFTSAISITIIASQVKSLLGLKIVAHSFLELIWLIAENVKNIKINDTTLGLSCMLFLFTFKQLTKIKMKNTILRKTLWFLSISRNAIIVIITSFIAYYYCQVDGRAPFSLSSKVPSGLPQFSFPKFSAVHNNQTVTFFDMIHSLRSGVIVLPICAILTNVAIAKSFAKEVIVDASQEMITLGLCNIFGSCVQAIPSSGSFSRSAVANASGVRTPLQGLYSGTIIILALSFLTPYFYYIPKATLAAVLISAVSTMIEYEILPVLWRTNKIDFFLALLTCIVGVICGSDFGIITGAMLNLIVLLKDWSRPNVVVELKSVRYRVSQPKFSPPRITSRSDLDKILRQTALECEKSSNYIYIKPQFGLCYPARDYLTEKIMEAHSLHECLPIVLDCGNILRIDHAGAEALKNVLEMYNNENNRLILINLIPEILTVLEKLMNSDKLQYCLSSSTLYDEIFDVERQDDTKVPLLAS